MSNIERDLATFAQYNVMLIPHATADPHSIVRYIIYWDEAERLPHRVYVSEHPSIQSDELVDVGSDDVLRARWFMIRADICDAIKNLRKDSMFMCGTYTSKVRYAKGTFVLWCRPLPLHWV